LESIAKAYIHHVENARPTSLWWGIAKKEIYIPNNSQRNQEDMFHCGVTLQRAGVSFLVTSFQESVDPGNGT
jgi:hypothetical protein